MKGTWLALVPAALLLGSATPPPPPLDLDTTIFTADAEMLAQPLVLTVDDPEFDLTLPLRPPPPPDTAGAVRILVSLPQQTAYVFRGADLVATSRVSTGKRGHETPVGTFHISQKAVHHRSNIYSNAPMPYMQRLTSGGVALHAGHLPGYPASHGCIRLPWSFAKRLYGLTGYGTKVTVTRTRPKSTKHALTLA